MHDTKDTTCKACDHPCEEHKEHTHGKMEADHVCSSCGHTHKEGESCDCGCK